MTKKTYVDFISTAAHLARRDLDALGVSLAVTWDEYEYQAQMRGYDVFKDFDACRAIGRRLVEQLYSVPGADQYHDVTHLLAKDREYGGSWQKRGGVGAFMMAARKWDRIEKVLVTPVQVSVDPDTGDAVCERRGLAWHLKNDKREEGLLDDLGDLRRYLILFEAWYMSSQDPSVSAWSSALTGFGAPTNDPSAA